MRDASDLADLLRMGRLPEAWVAPPAVRELREQVRHRCKLVALRSGLKAQVHAVLARQGVLLPMSDLFTPAGRKAIDDARLDAPFHARTLSLLRLIEAFDFEIDVVTKRVTTDLKHTSGYQSIQAIPGVGPVLAAVFVAEIGDVTRFPRAAQLCSWAGMTPRHRESDTKVHRGRITKQGNNLVRWAAVEAVQRVHYGPIAAVKARLTAKRGNNIAKVAGTELASRKKLRGGTIASLERLGHEPKRSSRPACRTATRSPYSTFPPECRSSSKPG